MESPPLSLQCSGASWLLRGLCHTFASKTEPLLRSHFSCPRIPFQSGPSLTQFPVTQGHERCAEVAHDILLIFRNVRISTTLFPAFHAAALVLLDIRHIHRIPYTSSVTRRLYERAGIPQPSSLPLGLQNDVPYSFPCFDMATYHSKDCIWRPRSRITLAHFLLTGGVGTYHDGR